MPIHVVPYDSFAERGWELVDPLRMWGLEVEQVDVCVTIVVEVLAGSPLKTVERGGVKLALTQRAVGHNDCARTYLV